MGIYVNPGNKEFWRIRNSKYVDKTGLIDVVNDTLFTVNSLSCVSRPRRFGKSFAAQMLCAYFDRSCDSGELFEGLEISNRSSFEKNLNHFNVIYLDVTWFISRAADIRNVVSDIQESVIKDLITIFPGSIKNGEKYMADAMLSVASETGDYFYVIIDEWDALFREAKEDKKLQREYIQLLRSLFKGGNVGKMLAGAYMTGILPIKKYGTESALTDFREYSMTNPDQFAEYVGFTETEVMKLCEENNVDFEQMRQWYDGYSFCGLHSVYNPNSVMEAINRKYFRSYWTRTETFESLKQYISMNFDGLKDAVILMLGGQKVKVDTTTFQNDVTSVRSKDDVLTLLIHLGYLTYNETESEVMIPNLEVADAFRGAVKMANWEGVTQAITKSDQLLQATIEGREDQVAAALEDFHSEASSILQYNNENSLACAITIAYYTARNYYEIVRELPTGKGFADIALIPHENTGKPAMIIELKYDKDADSAIRQIKNNCYGGILKNYSGELLLVGINYDKNARGEDCKKHSCVIEEV